MRGTKQKESFPNETYKNSGEYRGERAGAGRGMHKVSAAATGRDIFCGEVFEARRPGRGRARLIDTSGPYYTLSNLQICLRAPAPAHLPSPPRDHSQTFN